jgi:hypothetical protein
MRQLLVGVYDNAAQMTAAPEDLRRPPAAGHPYDWIDLQHAAFFPVSAPALGEAVLYLEWRAGGPDGPISRQRIWAFRRDAAGAPVMDFFTIRAPERFAGRGAEPGAFAALSPDDLVGYGEACALRVALLEEGGFLAQIRPEACRITARSGRSMGIAADVRVRPGSIEYAEAGILEDGSYAFKVPGAGAYELRSLAD